MQRLEVSCAVRHIYIYVVRSQRVNIKDPTSRIRVVYAMHVVLSEDITFFLTCKLTISSTQEI